VPDSTRRDARHLRHALIALPLAIAALSGCGAEVPDISVPSIPNVSDATKAGSATFNINGVTFTVAQSGTIQADFPESKQITYSGPLGCKGHYFSGEYTENIDVYFHYFKNDAYLLIDNGPEPVYRFGPPQRRGDTLVFSNAGRSDRQITVIVNCPTGA
jgi:hypothetical protein